MAVLGISVLALLSGVAWGTSSAAMARENQRATQILIDRMETIRLYGFDQITNRAFLPPSQVIVDFSSKGTSSNIYLLTIGVTNRVLNANYSNDVALISLDLRWQSGRLQRQRNLSTYVYRDGLHNFVN